MDWNKVAAHLEAEAKLIAKLAEDRSATPSDKTTTALTALVLKTLADALREGVRREGV